MALDFKDLKNFKGKELSKRDINMVLTAVALIILVVAYLVGFQKISEKKTTLENDLNTRSAYLTELKGYVDNLKAYQDGTESAKLKIDFNLDRLPVGFENEDFLLCMMKADEVVGTKMSSISYNSVDHVADFNTYIGDSYIPVQGYRASASCALTMTYKQFKDYLDYIYAEDYDYTYIDNISVTYNAESAELSATVNLSKFFIKYDGMSYVGEKGYDVDLGKSNPFGSK